MSFSHPWLAPAAAALALVLAVTGARGEVSREAALADAVVFAVLAALVWQAARRLYGAAGGTAALVAALFAAPLLGAVGGGALLAALLHTLALLLFARALLDPTIQLVVGAGLAGGAALAALHADGAEPGPALVALLCTAGALAAWRIATAERCEPRARVARAALTTVVLGGLLAAATGHALDALLPPIPEATDYGYADLWVLVHGGELDRHPPALIGSGWLALNGLALLLLPMLRSWRREHRYADGAALVALIGSALLPLLAHAPVLLAVLTTPWLALLAGGTWRAPAPPRVRVALVLLLLEVLSAIALWPDYPRATAGWPPPLLVAAQAGPR